MTTIDKVSTRTDHALWAGIVAVLLGGVALMSLPMLSEFWGARAWVQGMYLCSVFLLEALIALFLGMQALAGCSRALAWLSGGYAFTAVIAIAQIFTFPGLFNQPLAEDFAGQATIWLWVAWHSGFPCFALLALGAKAKEQSQPRRLIVYPSLVSLFPLLLATGAALVLSALLIRYAQNLPLLIEGEDYTRLRNHPLAGAIMSLNVIALAAVLYTTRGRELLHLWLAVALFAFSLDVLLSLLGTVRYSAGWYIGRGLSLVSAAALLVALLIEHFRLHRDAEIRAAFHEEEARHDPLTGLFNRRYLEVQLSSELGRARRYQHPLSVLLLDMDYFKKINDQHGHVVGDQCLRVLAETLDRVVHRQSDITARYGGEEFVVVLPETDVEGAVEVAEEIRRNVENLYARQAAPCPMTVSIGVATADPYSSPVTDEILAAADKCLYQAKQGGRNRVVWRQPPAGPGRFEPKLA